MQLYTITTVILTGQTVYYSHIYHRLKAKKARATSKVTASDVAYYYVLICFYMDILTCDALPLQPSYANYTTAFMCS
jgi:hypothetical protein